MEENRPVQPDNRALEQWRPGIGRTIGFALFSLMLFPCVGAMITPLVTIPVGFCFGRSEFAMTVMTVTTYIASGVMTFGLVREAWKAKPYQPKSKN